MRIVETIDPISEGGVDDLPVWQAAWEQVREAITCVDWPHGSGKFTINPGKGKNPNGVLPIKLPCIHKLKSYGWKDEGLPRELAGVQIGNLDALLETSAGPIGFEWETGNISSSHRAINKILLAIFNGGLLGGVLAVPSEDMRRFLTDRIGNITELRPYLCLWKNIQVKRGILRIVAFSPDAVSTSVPLIPKQMDGNAFRVQTIVSPGLPEPVQVEPVQPEEDDLFKLLKDLEKDQ